MARSLSKLPAFAAFSRTVLGAALILGVSASPGSADTGGRGIGKDTDGNTLSDGSSSTAPKELTETAKPKESNEREERDIVLDGVERDDEFMKRYGGFRDQAEDETEDDEEE